MILVWVLASALALALAAAGWIARGFWDHAEDDPPASTLIADDITEELARIPDNAPDAFAPELHQYAEPIGPEAPGFQRRQPDGTWKSISEEEAIEGGWGQLYAPVPDDTDRLASTGEMWMFRQTLALEDFRHEFLSAEWAGRVLAEAWR